MRYGFVLGYSLGLVKYPCDKDAVGEGEKWQRIDEFDAAADDGVVCEGDDLGNNVADKGDDNRKQYLVNVHQNKED